MKAWILAAGVAFVTAALSGCVSSGDEPLDVPPTDVAKEELQALLRGVLFSPKSIIDPVRAGGEPVIAVSPSGAVFVSSHPGWTHYHPSEDPTHPGLELLSPASAQSYLWKSSDGGATWRHIGLPMLEQGPRSTGFGVSDPEFTVMADGTICYTDLEGLAMSSVSCSDDDGETWIGNPVASGGPTDRQWLASYRDELYFTANYFVDHHIRASTDRGLTWEDRGDVPCSGDIIADPADGTLFAGCGDGVAVSEDAGMTWELRDIGADHGRAMTEPALDAEGNVWMTYSNGESLHLIGSPDQGETWPWGLDLTDPFKALSVANGMGGGNGTFVWPWVSAGSAGRVAVSWIGSYDSGSPGDMDTDWNMFSAFVADAHTDAPVAEAYQLSDQPIHHGPICQGGTGCQVSSMQGDDGGDRRLGDFFESTIDLEGNLHIVVSDTFAAKDDVISHVAYFRQTAGFPLLVAGDRPPTQG